MGPPPPRLPRSRSLEPADRDLAAGRGRSDLLEPEVVENLPRVAAERETTWRKPERIKPLEYIGQETDRVMTAHPREQETVVCRTVGDLDHDLWGRQHRDPPRRAPGHPHEVAL